MAQFLMWHSETPVHDSSCILFAEDIPLGDYSTQYADYGADDDVQLSPAPAKAKSAAASVSRDSRGGSSAAASSSPSGYGYAAGATASYTAAGQHSHAGGGGSSSYTASTYSQHATRYTAPAPAPAPAPAAASAEEYEYDEFNPYLFMKLLPSYRTVRPIMPRAVLPSKPAHMPEVNLVLDLDETLVHCSVDPIPDADVTFPVNFNGVDYQVYVRKRPYLDKFFKAIQGRFEVTIFTASQQVYAEALLKLLDPKGQFIHHKLYRDSCLCVDGNYLKDLHVLGRDLTKTVLVDNSPHAFGYQIDNGIPIESWFEDPADTELLKLASFLEELHGLEDVRTALRRKFQLGKLVKSA